MWDQVDVTMDAEGHLLERSTSTDISSLNVDDFPAGCRAEVLERYPLVLAEEFLSCFRSQAERKTDSSAAAAVRNNIAARIVGNRLDE